MTRLRPFAIPMRMRFRGARRRSGVLIEGPAGWGEFSPFPEYGSAYGARWLAAAREAAERGFPPAVRDRVEVNAIVPAVDPSTAARLAREAGCPAIKIKVAEPGHRLADDVARVAAVREAVGADVSLRVDANGAWDVETAVLALTRLAVYDLQYAEQPVATAEELRALSRRTAVPLAVDDLIRTAEDPVAVVRAVHGDVVVLKAQPLGGVERALEVAAAARRPVVVSSAVETSIGLAAGLALAAALPEPPLACGLGTATLLAADVTTDPLVPVDGALTVRRPAPDPGLLDACAPPPDEAADLLDRLAAADAADSRYR